MRYVVVVLAALAAGIAAPGSAEVVEIAPSSPWNVDFGENKCRLARLFGEGEARHLVFFEQYWPDTLFGMTAAGPSFKRYRSRQRTDVRFFAAQEPQRTEPFIGTIGPFGEGVVYSTLAIIPPSKEEGADEAAPTRLPQLDKDSARQVEFVALRQRGDEIRLMTGPLDEAFAVLDQCALDLIKGWGLDPAQHRTATRLPRWTNRDAVVRRIVAAYPRGAAARGEQGIMRMRVTVSAEGAVEDCTIIKATETEKLESPACKAMAEARFAPALDAAGQAMRSYFAESIVYQMQ